MESLEKAIRKAFIDKTIISDKQNPKFIVNNPSKKDFLLTTLHQELNSCQSFFISVAFITQDGLNAIKAQLSDLAEKGITGKILTSTYLGFNEPKVFTSLLQIPNVEVRISNKKGFHSKGYLFEKEEYKTFIIGSSNLTMSALKLNYEWNVKLTSDDNGEMLTTIEDHLAQEWEEATPLTKEWISDFEEKYQAMTTKKSFEWELPIVAYKEVDGYIVPNKMQQQALKNLAELRNSGARRGLIISATGTGKTYLAGFDVAAFSPKRMLFIVHREQILNKAMESFKKIMKGEDRDYGILSGTSKDLDAKYLFATIQTISKQSFQEQLGADAFDYILIDEVHKAGANSYRKTIDFFKPDFLLGMTATPERTDGFNIFELFDYNIAYEIRLQEALEEDMLCPFYYFGVTDYEKNGQVIDETSDLKYLTNQERVEFLIKKINYYGYSGDAPKGLVFCSRKDEAKEMAELFSKQGIPSTYLSGDHNLEKRELEVQRLEKGLINYIFTVDIFNEGIDIPKVNQVIMLRNTESSIIFIQQLGRGLRKDESKDFVTVIDFIGNYKNNYMIPMALSGDDSRNKNNIRRDTVDVTYISGLSSINFEKVARERIFKSIDQAKLNSLAELKSSFYKLKNRLNRVPYLLDFQKMDSVDPLIISSKEKTYYSFLKKIGEAEGDISESENLALRFISTELLSGIRPHELLILQQFLNLEKDQMSLNEIKQLFDQNNVPYTKDTLESVVKVLDLSFYEKGTRNRYLPARMFEWNDKEIFATDNLREYRRNDYFIKLAEDLVFTGLSKSEKQDLSKALNLYEKYRRKDVLRMLNMEFNQNEQGIGGYTYSNHHFAIFVTLDKGKDFKASLMAYEDEFIDQGTFKWFTKSPRTLGSEEVRILQNAQDWHIHLFIKRKYNDKDNETDFYYLGEMQPIEETIKQLQKPTSDGKLKNVVEMEFTLNDPVEANYYEFLTGSEEDND
jgi:superfamily II DNA or RNA helicase/HKD family nuclease